MVGEEESRGDENIMVEKKEKKTDKPARGGRDTSPPLRTNSARRTSHTGSHSGRSARTSAAGRARSSARAADGG